MIIKNQNVDIHILRREILCYLISLFSPCHYFNSFVTMEQSDFTTISGQSGDSINIGLSRFNVTPILSEWLFST